MAAKTETGAFVRAASLEYLRQRGRLAVRVGGHSLALFFEGEKFTRWTTAARTWDSR
jgi:hypothetical protein